MVNRLIKVSDVVNSVSFNRDGEVIFNMIKDALESGERVTVSFEGIYALNTSFVNSAFIELLENFSFEDIKRYVKFVDSTRQINSIIAKRFKDELENEILATV